jgi:hypothetical protein
MTYSFGSFARLISARSQSRPLRSIFAHSSGVSRMARCTCCSSGGLGGLPRGRFSCSMVRTVAPIYWDANNPCNPDLLGYSKGINKGTAMRKITRRVGSYPDAILWIACNDDTEWLDQMDAGEDGFSPSVTLCLVADVFARTVEEATDDLRKALAWERGRAAREHAAQEGLDSARAYVRKVLEDTK